MALDERRQALLGAFQESRAALMAAVEGLSEVQLIDPSVDGWSVKDHLAHIAQWDELRFFEINRISRGFETAHGGMTDEQVEAFNAMSSVLRRPISHQQVLWELEFSRARVLESIQNMTERGLEESRYGEVGLGSGASHEKEHAATIKRWRESRGV